MLGQHPEAYGVPELNLLTAKTVEQLTRDLTDIRYLQLHGLLRTVAQLYTGEQTLLSIEAAQRWIMTRSTQTTEEVYAELCHRVAPLRLVDHSRVYSSSLEILQFTDKSFPGAHYIHLVHHPRSEGMALTEVPYGNLVAIANNSIDYSTPHPTLDPQILWYKTQRTILDFLSQVPATQQMCLRCEDILREPAVYFKEVCCWLDLSWDGAILDAILRPEASPYAGFGPFGANLGDDPTLLRSPTFSSTASTVSHSNQLKGALPWRSDGKGFLPHVIQLAQTLGYE